MQKTKEKSEEQAQWIQLIGIYLPNIDVEYCKEVARDLINASANQQSIAVLNPSYPRSKNDLLHKQGEALMLLCRYIESLKQVDELKIKVSHEERQQDEINKMFI